MRWRQLHLVGDFMMKQDVRIMHVRRIGDPATGYDEVFTCAAEFDFNSADSDRELLEQLFEMFNVGNPDQDPIVAAYRAKGLRSLSVGDVVVLDEEVAWVCRAAGWEPVDLKDVHGNWLH